MIDVMTAILVFLLTAGMDALHAVYTKAVAESKAAYAATSGSLIYIVSAYAVIKYTENWMYLIFVCLGSWCGTYISVRYKS